VGPHSFIPLPGVMLISGLSNAENTGKTALVEYNTTGEYVPVPYVDSLGTSATGETIMVYRLVSDPAARVFLQTNPQGMSTRYRGTTMMVTKRMSNNRAVFSIVYRAEGRLGSVRALPTASAEQSGEPLVAVGGAERLREYRRPASGSAVRRQAQIVYACRGA
jgi:hypothetical protein